MRPAQTRPGAATVRRGPATALPGGRRAPGERWARRWVWALPVWGLLLGMTTLTQQPDPGRDFDGYSDYVTTAWFRISHLGGSIAGAGLGLAGAFALALLLLDTPGATKALRGAGLFAVGQALTIAVFGAAAFAQPAIGATAHRGDVETARRYDDLVYAPPLFATAALGLLTMIAGTILLGRALTTSGRVPSWPAITFAVAAVVFYVSGLPGLLLQPLAGLTVALATAVIAHRLTVPAPG